MQTFQGIVWRTLVVLLLMGAPAVTMPEQNVPQSRYAEDPRLDRLQSFFKKIKSPVAHLAEDFLIVADTYDLDWRLLPSISFVESSAGRHYKNNNIFGWNNCDTRFNSIRDGIYYVGERMAESHYYKGKTVEDKLKTYNPFPHYRPTVMKVMSKLGPSDLNSQTITE